MATTNTNKGALRPNAKRHRVQLNFSDGAFEELKQLEKEMTLSRQNLFQYALRWLQWTYGELLKGGEIQVKESNGEVKRVVAPFLTK